MTLATIVVVAVIAVAYPESTPSLPVPPPPRPPWTADPSPSSVPPACWWDARHRWPECVVHPHHHVAAPWKA